jgi:hypothetical protein
MLMSGGLGRRTPCPKVSEASNMSDVKPRMQMAKTPLSRTSPLGHPLLLQCNTEGSVYRESTQF